MKRWMLVLLLCSWPCLGAVAQGLVEFPAGLVERVEIPGGPVVLLQSMPDLSSVSVALVISSGSLYDEAGKSGQAHLLEHLMFRATSSQPDGSLLVNLEQIGARAGARTTPTHLIFWETVPSQYLDFTLRTQAERLLGLQVNETDLKREKELALAEIKNGRDAGQRLEELRRALYSNYRSPQGVEAELKALSVADLKQHHQLFCGPERAVIAVVGGFSPREARSQLQRYFKADDASTQVQLTTVKLQAGRGGRLEQPDRSGIEALFAMRGPADRAALSLAEAALGGGSGNLLKEAGFEVTTEQGPGGGSLRVHVSPGANRQDNFEQVLTAQLEALAEPLPFERLETLKTRALANYYRRLESPVDRAVNLAVEESTGTLESLGSLPEAIRTVTPAALAGLVNKQLELKNAALGVGAAEGTSEPADDSGKTTLGLGPIAQNDDWRLSPRPASVKPPAFTRHELENGLTVLVQPVPELPTVTVRGYLKGGALLDPRDKPGLTYSSSLLLGQGSKKYPSETFARTLEDQGSLLHFQPGRQVVSIEGWTLSEKFVDFMDLLADGLRAPDPDQESYLRVRQLVANRAWMMKNSPSSRLAAEFLSSIYPFDHPYGVPPLGPMDNPPVFASAELFAHLRRICRPDRLVLVFSGDVSDATVLRSLRPELTAWYVEQTPPIVTIPTVPNPEPKKTELSLVGELALVAVGHPGPARRDSDYYAFNLLNQILGGNPVTSRLARRLRDRDKLVTSVRSQLLSTSGPVPWGIFITAAPENVEKAVAAALEEVKALQQSPPSAAEIEQAINALQGSLQVSQSSAEGRAELLSNLEFHRLSDSYLESFSGIYQRIEAGHLLETARKRFMLDHLVQVILAP